MRSPFILAVAACCLIGLFSCTDENTNRSPSTTDFDSFARTLFGELQARPISPEHQVGLFGDLDVLAGENVVMGRYRFRVDTTGDAATAHMAFHVRGGEASRAIPVVLAFAPRDNQWHLEDVQVLAEDANAPARSYGTDSLHTVLSSQLDTWVSTAVEISQR